MPQQTTMAIYQDIVLECQHCYIICRYTETVARRNCPACGLTITNWAELTQAIQAKAQPLPDASRGSASTG
jgi:predicted RNA-binding Zn-ribbon protein involved in translation (DUF1610 family)